MSEAPESKATPLKGKPVAERIQQRVAGQVRQFEQARGRAPGLTVVLVGDDPPSKLYVSSKESAAREVGIASKTLRLPAETSQSDLLSTIDDLNGDETVDGILVQLPLPSHVESSSVLSRLDPDKDVDGFHPVNVGRLQLGLPGCRPCTPAGVMEALRQHEVELSGRHAVVVGRSNIVGKPMATLLLAENATVTTCHSRTADLPGTCRQADVLVVAVGRPGMIGGDAIKPGATVIDVGTNRIESPADDELALKVLGEGTKRHERYRERGFAVVGDVNGREAARVAGLLTPVPGGVGPLTIAMLLANTVEAAARRTDTPLDS